MQPGLPMNRGRAGTVTHDYERLGTTTLFAALNTLDGSAISMCQPCQRHGEWLKLLKLIDGRTPKHLSLHLIADNYATHRHPHVREWLVRHPRFIMHFNPTSASWLNMVERFFRDITDKRTDATTSPASQNWNSPSICKWHITTSIPSHSSGPTAHPTSWPR